MANVLKMTMAEAIHSMRSTGLSSREITVTDRGKPSAAESRERVGDLAQSVAVSAT